MASNRRNKIIMGTAMGLAAIAAAIDHTRHPLPEARVLQEQSRESQDAAPCGLGEPYDYDQAAPCGLAVDTDE